MERIGVLEKVEFSDWGTSIVPVLKLDGTLRICVDCKVTVNPASDVLEYPMPMAEELFTQLNGGTNGQMFLLVVDAKSKWIELFPMSSTTASMTILALRFLFATHGLPEVIVSDNSPQFVAQEMKDFLR